MVLEAQVTWSLPLLGTLTVTLAGLLIFLVLDIPLFYRPHMPLTCSPHMLPFTASFSLFRPQKPSLTTILKIVPFALAEWCSSLEHHRAHQKVAGSIPVREYI